tara:strand:+ start:72 stop:539 length:468 start_codon:yes stop_codon:yes gene_type:complete
MRKNIKSTIHKDCIKWKSSEKCIVFTNGCFDLLHKGHTDLLAASAKFGDILIVGVNSDISVKMLKGEGRPIQPESIRLDALIKTGLVSRVYLFDDETPLNLIKIIKPDILVKGGDYLPDEVVGKSELAEWGGKVKIVPLTPGYSTTNTIQKMNRQ